MDNLRGIIEYIRNIFIPTTTQNFPRKRRAVDPLDTFLSPKSRRLHISMADDFDDDIFSQRFNSKMSPRLPSKSNRHIDTIVLDDDDDDDIIEIKKPYVPQSRSKYSKYTSTPGNCRQKLHTNGFNGDEIEFVKVTKSPKEKFNEASQLGLNYIKPFTGRTLNVASMQNGTKSTEKNTFSTDRRKSNNSHPSVGSSSLDYSFRLDDKMQYKKLLESAGGSKAANGSSVYFTPVGKLFTYDTSNRSGKILNMLKKTPLERSSSSSRDRMTTKDTIIKVLDEYGSIEVKDSDSDSDVIFVNPPSPKPDIKVDPVNSFKKVVDTSQQTKKGWLDDLVERHRSFVEERQKEIDQLRVCSEKQAQINKDMRWEVLSDKVKKSLSIRDAVLPVEEEEEEVELPALTEEQLKLVERAHSRGDPNEIFVKKFDLNITRRDLLTLAGLNWLNDEVINFYMNLIIERGKDSKWPKAFAFNTFFYIKLLRDGPQSLRRWTKRVDIFQHDIICVPIHLGMHWCMAIIDLREKSIKYYDSMGGNNNKCLDALRRYLEAEHLDKKKSNFDTSEFVLENVKDIPQQMNGSDCGMFACTFAEFLTRNAKITFSQEHMPYLRKKMAVEIITGELLIK